MPKWFARWWLTGFGVVLIGCFVVTAGLASWLRDPVGVIELVDGIVIGAICFIVGAVMLFRHAPDTLSSKPADEGPRI
jgi:hypothetical protein